MEEDIAEKGTARTAEFSTKKPLPPIGSNEDADKSSTASGTQSTDRSGARRKDDDERSVASSRGSAKSGPRVLRGFRREIFTDDDDSDEEVERRSKSKRGRHHQRHHLAALNISNNAVVKDEIKSQGQTHVSPDTSTIDTRPSISKRKAFDGREVTFVTLDTQTDWDWVEEVEQTGTARTIASSPDKLAAEEKEKQEAEKKPTSKTDVTDDKDLLEGTQYPAPRDDEYGIPILDLSSDTDDELDPNWTPTIRSYVHSRLAARKIKEMKHPADAEKKSSDEETSHKKVKDDRTFIPSVGPPNILQIRNLETRYTLPANLICSMAKSQQERNTHDKSKLRDRRQKLNKSPQYQRESEQQEISVEDPESRIPAEDYDKDEDGLTHGMFSGQCEFCKNELKPFPTVEQQLKYPPELLYCCNDYREFVEFVLQTSEQLEAEQQKKNRLISIKPHEHVGSKQERNAAKEKAVQRMRERELQRRQQEASGLQQNFFASGQSNTKNRPPGGGIVPMKDAFGPPKVAPGPAHSIPGPHSVGAAVARQMKTINYQLSSQKCLEEGWTLKPPSPLPEEEEEEVFTPEPLNPALLADGKTPRQLSTVSKASSTRRGNTARQQSNVSKASSTPRGITARQKSTFSKASASPRGIARRKDRMPSQAPSTVLDDLDSHLEFGQSDEENSFERGLAYRPDSSYIQQCLLDRPLIEKFYESGQKFVTMFPDGTGNVFYPSGNLAVLISSVKLGQYHYTIHHDLERSGVAAAFEPNGCGYCYFPNGDVRLYIDQYGGIELDANGGKKRKWTWKDQVTHVHAPPFQPICIGLNKHMGLRVMSQDNIALTFSASRRSCRFNMGVRLKLVAPENIPLKEIEENSIFLEEKRNHVETLLSKVANLLKFPNSPKVDKMLPPMHVTTKINKTEKLKQERQVLLARQAEREKKQPSIAAS